jgi:uncharacterized protein (TIGR04255 family)
MVDYETFKNPPITEAIVDIRVEFGSEFNSDHLQKICAEIKEQYPIVENKNIFQTTVQIASTGNSPSSSTIEPHGFFCYSADKTTIIQNRIDGFTFNKLKPYENWEKIKNESKSKWDIYSKITQPVKILRIALRYINQIEIPLPIRDFKDYFKTTPEIAPTLPQALSQFYMQLVIPDNEDTGATAIINQTFKYIASDKKLFYIFDIDAQKNLNITVECFDVIWNEFEKLRKFKNRIFHESLTNEAKELFR